MTDQRKLIREAIEHFGTQEEMAAATGFCQSLISQLLNNRKSVSPTVAVAIERATNGAVTKEMLCPDLFGEGGR